MFELRSSGVEMLEGRTMLSAATGIALNQGTAAAGPAVVQSLKHANPAATTAAPADPASGPDGGPDGENVDGGPTGGPADAGETGTETPEVNDTPEAGDTTDPVGTPAANTPGGAVATAAASSRHLRHLQHLSHIAHSKA